MMQRIMIIGQPGSGKSTLARAIGKITELPVIHIDQIHWQAGWIERSASEKTALCSQAHANEKWIFEGGHSSTWPERLERCDTLIWLDIPFSTRLYRILRRTLRYWGRSRPDLPEGCPDKLRLEFLKWIWSSRHSAREKSQKFYQKAPRSKTKLKFQSIKAMELYLSELRQAFEPTPL